MSDFEPSLGTLIIIPAYNERDNLPAVLKELAEVVPDADVLVVDDGSTDGTADVARAAGAMVARLPFNLGVGGALRTGFRYAADEGYERALQFDGDGQHDPHEVSGLVTALNDGADMVVGSRFVNRAASYEVGRVRRGGMRLLRVLVLLLSGHRFSDTSSGFRGFSRSMIEFFSRTYPADYLGDTVEALLLACYAGYRVVEVPVNMRQRSGGEPSHRSVRLLYRYVLNLIVIGLTAPVHRRVKQGA